MTKLAKDTMEPLQLDAKIKILILCYPINALSPLKAGPLLLKTVVYISNGFNSNIKNALVKYGYLACLMFLTSPPEQKALTSSTRFVVNGPVRN